MSWNSKELGDGTTSPSPSPSPSSSSSSSSTSSLITRYSRCKRRRKGRNTRLRLSREASQYRRDLTARAKTERRMGLKSPPTINGKEVNLDLLYQIVTSHGGWEKVNNRNEWDDLLEHFHLPRGTNGGLVIKQIYLKYLETYEKVYFLGEDVHNNDNAEDDYDDFRHRRRHAHKVTSRSNSHVQGTPDQQQSQQPQLPVPIPEHLREQLGLSTQVIESTDYDRLLLSLQSPLPNDQDLAISICTLLSNETKHVLKFSKCPAVLNLLLAHAGIYQHCGLRMLMEETYMQGRKMSHAEFWKDVVDQSDIRPLLCESYVDRVQTSLGLNEDEDSTTVELEEPNEPDLMDENDTAANLAMQPKPPPTISPELTPEEEEEEDLFSPNSVDQEKPEVAKSSPKNVDSASCCSSCPCQKMKAEFDNIFPKKQRYTDRLHPKKVAVAEDCSLPFCLSRSARSDDKVGQRISQIANILRNLSFEEDNFSVMASNPTLLRYLLITANCSWGNLPQISFDVLGNIAGHIKLQDPMKDPISSMLLTLISTGLFSTDRFRVLRSLEILRELTRIDRNERIIVRYLETKVYKRMCELLTICDIMMLIYTLECILSMTGLGEAVCNELVRVKGSVATLVSLVTVEAQSYGPKGCILMRVVETVTGSSQSTQIPSTQNQTTTTVSQPIAASSPSTSGQQQLLQSSSPPVVSANSIQSIGLRTVTGYTVVPPAQQQTASPSGYGAHQPINTSQPQMTLGAVNLLNITPPIQNQPQLRTVFRATSINAASTTTLQPVQVQVSRSAGSVSPSLSLNRPVSPSPSPTPVAQIQGKCVSLPAPSNHLNSNLVSNSASITSNNISINQSSNSVILMSSPSAPTLTTNSTVNHINHAQTNSVTAPAVTTGAGATQVSGSLAQVSSHSISQQVYSPSINLVTPKGTLSEEGWATAWVKGAFESSTGTSIEQGEIYRMYCAARKNPVGVLSMDQFIQCVKTVYGASVGPVMKPFMSTSLTFIEGIRPKITLRPAGSVGAAVANSVVAVNASHVAVGNNETQSLPISTSNGVGGTKTQNNSSVLATTVRSPTPVQVPVSSMHIPSPLSPILKATLSRPPTPKSPPGENRGRAVKAKDKKHDASKVSSRKKKCKKNPANLRTTSKEQSAAKILSPSSSAIRSLLASKVAQRQQKKLQQQQTKGSKSKINSVGGKKTKLNQTKMNGVETGSEVGEESSTSSSIISTEGSEIKSDSSTITFKGVLCNGINTEESSKLVESMELEVDGLDESGKNSRIKGMLVDLLERKVLPRDPVNGLVGREIRISDKGLELIEKDESETVVAGASLMNNTLGVSDSHEPQQMTFYASPPEVVSSSRVQSTSNADVSNTSGTVLLSGGGSLKAQQPLGQIQIVKVNKMLDQGTLGLENVTLTSGGDGDGISISSSETSSNGGGDLLEKFSQFSDLIVVNPEQLGLKRNASTLNSEGTTESSDQAPPTKKPTLCVNGSDVHQGSQAPVISSVGPVVSSSPSVLQAALSLSAANASNISSSTSDVGPVTLTSTNNNNQMMHLPMRLSVNPQNPNHLTFARQLVINPSGQQFLLSTGNSQSGVTGIQGQVIISKPSGSSNDQIPKAIIILQSQPQNHPGQPTISQPLPVGQAQVQNSISQPVKVIAKREGVPPSEYSHIPIEQLEQELPFLCEWTGCSLRFNKHQQVYMHAISVHCPESLQDAIRCEWGANGCDPLLRKRYSIMTHLQDRHCSKQALELAVYRRKNKIEPPPAPQQPVHHPGYAPNAAFHAIKRHALQFVSPKEMADENEGPVTKSIRLTSALILRNLVNFSTLGKRILGGYESHLSSIAMSNVESSRTIAQLLHDMNESSS